MGEVGRGRVRSLELGLVKSGVPQQASEAGGDFSEAREGGLMLPGPELGEGSGGG